MKVAIIGQGYVGSALGKAAHEAGHQVVGIEINKLKRDLLSENSSYSVYGDYSKVAGSSVVVIAVPTPLDENRNPDLSYLKSALHSLGPVMNENTLVVNESTSFPGTLRNVIAGFLGNSFLYASAPERVDPGNSIWEIKNTPRLISGLNEEATKRALDFYGSFCEKVIQVSSPEIAEAAKLFENTFRQVNIALVNEFSKICQALEISTTQTLDAAATKPFGFMRFVPSIGVGGHCIPVDPSYLSYVAKQAGVEASFIDLANQMNSQMPIYIASQISRLLGDLAGISIQIAGIAYKADVADIRESPALLLIQRLRDLGAVVTWHDEVVGRWGDETSTELKPVDLGVIATVHSDVDFGPWRNSGSLVIDVSTHPNTGWTKFL